MRTHSTLCHRSTPTYNCRPSHHDLGQSHSAQLYFEFIEVRAGRILCESIFHSLGGARATVHGCGSAHPVGAQTGHPQDSAIRLAARLVGY